MKRILPMSPARVRKFTGRVHNFLIVKRLPFNTPPRYDARFGVMRVLHLITSLSVGGAEQMLVKLLRALDRRAFEPTVVTLVDDGALIEVVRDMGIRVETTGLRRGEVSLRGLRRLTKVIQRHDPDLIQSWMYHANTAASLARPWIPRKTPIVWNIRQSLYDLSRERFLTRAVIRCGRFLAPHADAIVNNAHISQEQHARIGYENDRSVVIPNGFEVDRFRPDPVARASVRTELGIPLDATVIGMAARVHPQKDHAGFLESARIASAVNPRLHFLLVGRGTDEGHLWGGASAQELQHRVRRLGERADVARLMCAMDILVSPSRWGEGCPNVVGEAMACGIHVIGTNIGDTAHVIGDCGVVVEAGQPSALAEAMLHAAALAPSARFAIGDAARARIRAHYSIHSVAEKYAQLWEETIAKRRGVRPSERSVERSVVKPKREPVHSA